MQDFKVLSAVLAGLVLLGCSAQEAVEPDAVTTADVEASAQQDAALMDALTPDFTGQPDWRAVDPEDLLLIDTRHGQIAIELADQFAPNHAARMRQAARDGFFDGLSFYRVIDGFVAQGGRGEDEDALDLPQYPPLTGEFFVSGESVEFTPMMDTDLYADRAGHVDGFPSASNADGSEVWPIHCPGMVAMARGNEPDSGDVEFYIVLGHGPRHLDRIMSVFGRVIDGMEHVQALRRGDPAVNSGVIADAEARDIIRSMRVAADLPEAERPSYEVMNTAGEAFHNAKAARRNRTHEFFFETPPAVIEACHMPGPVRRR